MKAHKVGSRVWMAMAAAALLVVPAVWAQQPEKEQPAERGKAAAEETPAETERAKAEAEEEAKSHTGEFGRLGEGIFTMTVEGEGLHSHEVTEATKVTINGQPARLEDLEEGDRIKVTTGPGNVALAIEATREPAAAERPAAERQPVILGVRIGPSPTTGVYVLEVMPESPASRAGIQQRDYILEIDGHKIGNAEEFDEAMQTLKPGDEVDVVLWRDRQKHGMSVAFPEQRTAAYRPEDPAAAQDGARAPAEQAWLGVMLGRREEGQPGVAITRVYPSGPAARAGLRGGDILWKVAGEEIATPADAVERIRGMKPGQEVEFTILRDGEERSLTATLADRADFFPRTFAGAPGDGEETAGDFPATVPPHAMLLEQHRRVAEQHQRIERILLDLQQQVQELRQEVQELKKEKAAEETNETE